MRGVNFYLGDERFVPADHIDSNSNMVRNSLFPFGVGEEKQFFAIDTSFSSPEVCAQNYDKLIPKSFDVALFGIGLDGHIASIFPQSELFDGGIDGIRATKSAVNHLRITVTPPVIESTKNIFLLANGKVKSDILKKIFFGAIPKDIPASLALGGVWLLDEDSARSLPI